MKPRVSVLVGSLLFAGLVGLAPQPAPASSAPATPGPGSLSLVSVGSPEDSLVEGSIPSGISNDGRYVLFFSQQPHLVPGETGDGGRYVYLSDTLRHTTTRLTSGTLGWLMGTPAISGDGRYAVVPSVTTTTSPEQTRLRLYDRVAGTSRTIAVSDTPPTESVDWYTAGISDDGRKVVYVRTSYTGVDNLTEDRGYVYDTVTRRTRPLMAGLVGGTTDGSVDATVPAVSRDGRYVALEIADDPTAQLSTYRLVRLDTRTGTRRVIGRSAATGIPVNAFGYPSISDGGRLVGYSAVGADGSGQAWVYDAVTRRRTLVSHAATGGPGADYASAAQVSGDGRYAVYTTASTRIVPGATSLVTAYRHDNRTGRNQVLVTPAPDVYTGDFSVGFVHIDEDGDAVALVSTGRHLAPRTTGVIERTYVWRP